MTLYFDHTMFHIYSEIAFHIIGFLICYEIKFKLLIQVLSDDYEFGAQRP